MKKSAIRIALAFCLVFLAFLLVSCSPGGGGDRTEATTWDGHYWDEGKVVSKPTCSQTGLMLYKCTECGETKTEVLPTNDRHEFKAGDKGRIVTPPTATKDGEIEKICTLCGKGVVTSSITYADYNTQVTALKTEVGQFTSADVGGSKITANLGSTYTAPSVSPTVGQHPRVLFTQSSVSKIEAALHETRSSVALDAFRTILAKPTDGKLPASSAHNNFDSAVLEQIQVLALDYALTKNEISGYGAIRALLNHLKTMDFYSIVSNQERQYGYTMYTAACVYDWCYGLLTQTTRNLIVSGVQHFLEGTNANDESNMEMGFPPSGQYSVAGHGCEFQLLRDYLSFAIAIYDEYPGWWNYIAGRIFAEYVTPRNYYYQAGMVTQGVSVYVRIRFVSDLYSAWLLKAATGSMPYDEANMKEVMRTVYSYELPNENAFSSGDDKADDGTSLLDIGRLALISSYLFDDATIRAQLEYHKTSYSKFNGFNNYVGYYTVTASVMEYLICSSNGVKAAESRFEDLDLIRYNGGWLGQIIARNNWSENQAAVLMKIGVRTGGNHDHSDAGQFQIWYKTMLAGDTGDYDGYGIKDHPHWGYYHQATVAHNCILINGQGQPKRGGHEMSHRNYLTDNNTLLGEVLGFQYDYADAAQTKPTYAYIAGDITTAYADAGSTTSGLASEVQRRMLAVYDTGNADVPLFFFVFDNITAKGSYKKTFLLHVPADPTISDKTVTVQKSGAKLVLQNVIGGNTLTKVSGYTVGSTQYPAASDGFWGRVEVTTSGAKTEQLVNVIYVCDANKTPQNVTATAISSGTVKGAVIGNVAAVFVASKTRQTSGFTITTSGSGDLTYYVSGVKEGNWTVKVGTNTQTVTATKDGGLLVFTAPAGTVTLIKN